MREKRENFEISDDEYLEWKLNFMTDTIKLQIIDKNKANCYVADYEKD